jgi:hypothetical protein
MYGTNSLGPEKLKICFYQVFIFNCPLNLIYLKYFLLILKKDCLKSCFATEDIVK